MKLYTAPVITALQLLMLPYSGTAAPLAEQFAPGVPYYFNRFDPEQRPWEPGQNFNIEEVFKNYQYYEIVFGQDGKEITVSQYIRGVKIGAEKYLKLPDGSLKR